MMLNDMKPGQLFQMYQQRRPHVYQVTGKERGQIGRRVTEVEVECVGVYDQGALRMLDGAVSLIVRATGARVNHEKLWVNSDRRVNLVTATPYVEETP